MGAHTPLQSTFVMHDGKIITLPLIYHTGYIYIYSLIIILPIQGQSKEHDPVINNALI